MSGGTLGGDELGEPVRILTRLGDAPLMVDAIVTDDWTAAATTYDVRATRVKGAFVVRPHRWFYRDEVIDPDNDQVCVEYGRHRPGDPRQGHFSSEMYERADRPVVNGVDLTGATVINTSRMRSERLTGRNVNVRRPIDEFNATRAPDATTERTAAVVHAIVTHWLTRDPHALVHRITAAGHAVHAQRIEDQRRRDAAEQEAEKARRELAFLDEREAARAVFLTAPAPA